MPFFDSGLYRVFIKNSIQAVESNGGLIDL
jgi:hypothetical protein